MRRPPPPSGFTLIELIVTMILVGVLAVAVLPRFDALGSFDAAGFADQLRSLLRHAQKTAIAQRRNVAVTFSTGAASLCSYSGGSTPCAANCAGASGVSALPPPGGTFRAAGAGTAVAASTVCFDAVGRPYQGSGALAAPLAIPVTGSGSTVATLRLEPETGYVR